MAGFIHPPGETARPTALFLTSKKIKEKEKTLPALAMVSVKGPEIRSF
jgi:hypothetical protein